MGPRWHRNALQAMVDIVTASNTNLYDKRGPALHDLRWDLVQLTILDGHDFELGAESELEWQRLQRRVVVDVQRLERLQGADLLGQVRQRVLSHREVLQL